MIFLEFVGSARVMLEEAFLMAEGSNPAMCAGVEGLGTSFFIGVAMAACDVLGLGFMGGESVQDTFRTLSQHRLLCWLSGSYFLVSFSDAWINLKTIQQTSGVTKTIVCSCTVFGIWLVQLSLFYASHGRRGSAWSPRAFGMLASMVVCVFCIYRFYADGREDGSANGPPSPPSKVTNESLIVSKSRQVG